MSGATVPVGIDPGAPALLGARVRELRLAQVPAVSQLELATRAGLSESLIKKLEEGARDVGRVATLRLLAAALGTDVPALLAPAGTPAGPGRAAGAVERSAARSGPSPGRQGDPSAAPDRHPPVAPGAGTADGLSTEDGDDVRAGTAEDRRTRLAVLLSEWPMTRYEALMRFNATARALDEDVTVSARQFDRWANGDGSSPRPAAHRVLEAAFGLPAAELLARHSDTPRPYAADADSQHIETERQTPNGPANGGTLLRALLRERHWQSYSAFCEQYDKAAAQLNVDLVGSWPSRPQLQRWLSGSVKGLPYPDHCRVLEVMFSGYTARQLFGKHQTPLKTGSGTANEVLLAEQVAPARIEAVSDTLFRLSDAILTGSLYSGSLIEGSVVPNERLDRVERRLAAHWKQYQSGIYRPALAQLPDLLGFLDAGVSLISNSHAEDVKKISELRSRAYQLAASLAYKFGDHSLGLIAAERGLSAAGHADNSLLGGVALTRLTHGLRDAGHLGRATDLNLRGAAAVEDDGFIDDPARASVYGALLLHGALATARKGDSSTARSLLKEAATVSHYSGESNHYYTAFGPTNVAVWSVAVFLHLGDTSSALQVADKVNPDLLPVAERKGAFLLDHANAHVAHGHHDERVVDLLLTAESLAPDEIHGRPASRTLVEDLLNHSQPTWSESLQELHQRITSSQ